MRHTSGLTYGFTGDSTGAEAHRGRAHRESGKNIGGANVEAIATLPLMHQPGEVWEYSVSTDVLGRVDRGRSKALSWATFFGLACSARSAWSTPPFSFLPQSSRGRRSQCRHKSTQASARSEAQDRAATIRIGRRRALVDDRRLMRVSSPMLSGGGALDGRAHPRPADDPVHGERSSGTGRRPE